MALHASSTNSLESISKWLGHVDQQVPPGVGVEMLKLALYHPFIKTEYAAAQGLKTPTEIYHFLLRKHFNHNKQKALEWFVHALCCLQSSRSRGKYLVGRACQKRYEITLPAPPKDISNEQKFYECLTKICDKAQGTVLEKKLKAEFSKKGILDTNPEHLCHLPQMFFRLIQREIVGPKCTKRLIRTIKKYQSDDDTARWCLFYLNDYLKSAGMPQIPSMQGVTRGQY